jgi:transmembrane sensor
MNSTDEATDWLIRAREGELTPAEREQLAGWLAESPKNVREYLETGELWVALQSHDIRPSESKEHLLELMRNHESSNVFELRASEHPKKAESEREKSAAVATAQPRWVRPLAAAAASATIALLAWTYSSTDANVYKTARGEQRYIVLSDNSVVQLNTLSTLVVHMDKQQRNIELMQGEAYFRVAHDLTRPFVVRTPYARVRALGTAFDVYNRAESTRVAVIEGKVTVHSSAVPASGVPAPNPEANTGVPLEAGQQVTVSHTVQPESMPVKAQNTTAWLQRRIVLDNDTVATAVAEFNRYNKAQIRVDTKELAALRINGVFNADDPRALVKFLQEVQGVNAKETADGIVLQP